MKVNYFSQEAADRDDAVLIEMIAQERVPSGCLLGGVIVQHYSALGEDPCGSCAAPDKTRARCGGRPRTTPLREAKDAPAEVKTISDNEAGARKLVRRQHIRTIITLFREHEGSR